MAFLFETGLLNNVCDCCGQVAPVQYESGSPFTRIACSTCKLRPSCTTNTALQWSEVRDVPLFQFVAQCFALHVSTKAMVSLSGADYRTVKKYIAKLQEAMCKKIVKERAEGRLKLGGQGKVVEIDEMKVCKRKYGRGRRLDKEGGVDPWSHRGRHGVPPH